MTLTERDGQTVVVIRGEINLATVPALAASMTVLDPGGPQLVIDLATVSSIDEVGVTLLIVAHGALAGDGRELVLDSPIGAVSEMLDRMGMYDIVTIRPEQPCRTPMASTQRQRRSEAHVETIKA